MQEIVVECEEIKTKKGALNQQRALETTCCRECLVGDANDSEERQRRTSSRREGRGSGGGGGGMSETKDTQGEASEERQTLLAFKGVSKDARLNSCPSGARQRQGEPFRKLTCEIGNSKYRYMDEQKEATMRCCCGR